MENDQPRQINSEMTHVKLTHCGNAFSTVLSLYDTLDHHVCISHMYQDESLCDLEVGPIFMLIFYVFRICLVPS